MRNDAMAVWLVKLPQLCDSIAMETIWPVDICESLRSFSDSYTAVLG